MSALTKKPVKITMTGPHMLAAVAYDEYYGDIGKMMLDLAKLLRRNFRTLADAGCRHIQIDEPLFSDAADAEVQAAADAINLAIEARGRHAMDGRPSLLRSPMAPRGRCRPRSTTGNPGHGCVEAKGNREMTR